MKSLSRRARSKQCRHESGWRINSKNSQACWSQRSGIVETAGVWHASDGFEDILIAHFCMF